MAWRPIETAPEGVNVLVYDEYEGVCVARMSKIRDEPFWLPHPSSRDSESLRPTHWREAPEPPDRHQSDTAAEN